MNLKVNEIIKCHKCGQTSRLNSIEVKDNKMIIAKYICECENKTNILVQWIDIITEKELLRKSIGELLDILKNIDKNKPVVTDMEGFSYIQNSFGSYRGNYTDLYIELCDNKELAINSNSLKSLLKESLNIGFMHGYKGREIDITEDTIVALAEYGSSGRYIIDIVEENDCVKITTEQNE